MGWIDSSAMGPRAGQAAGAAVGRGVLQRGPRGGTVGRRRHPETFPAQRQPLDGAVLEGPGRGSPQQPSPPEAGRPGDGRQARDGAAARRGGHVRRGPRRHPGRRAVRPASPAAREPAVHQPGGPARPAPATHRGGYPVLIVRGPERSGKSFSFDLLEQVLPDDIRLDWVDFSSPGAGRSATDLAELLYRDLPWTARPPREPEDHRDPSGDRAGSPVHRVVQPDRERQDDPLRRRAEPGGSPARHLRLRVPAHRRRQPGPAERAYSWSSPATRSSSMRSTPRVLVEDVARSPEPICRRSSRPVLRTPGRAGRRGDRSGPRGPSWPASRRSTSSPSARADGSVDIWESG